MDDIDLEILRSLKRDARKSYRDIAEKLGVAEGTVYNRIKKLLENGVLKGFIADIDYSKLGFDITAVIGIVVEGGHLLEIEREMSRASCVSAVYDVTGEYDALIVAKFRKREELNDFIKELLANRYVKRTYTMFVLNIFKEEHGVEF